MSQCAQAESGQATFAHEHPQADDERRPPPEGERKLGNGPSFSHGLSFFHDHFGYYAQGVGPETADLPKGWKDRLIRLQTPATNGRIAYCLDPVDLFVSKACAAREKDLGFNRAPLAHGVVRLDEVLARAEQLEDAVEARRATSWIHRLGA